MDSRTKKNISAYAVITTVYAAGLGVWAGTIYLRMKQVGFNYSAINLFLIIFWVVTFFAELPSGVIADT